MKKVITTRFINLPLDTIFAKAEDNRLSCTYLKVLIKSDIAAKRCCDLFTGVKQFTAAGTFKMYMRIAGLSAYNLVNRFRAVFPVELFYDVIFKEPWDESVYGTFAGRGYTALILSHFPA